MRPRFDSAAAPSSNPSLATAPLLGLLALILLVPAAWASPPDLQPSALVEIGALLQAKNERSVAQAKIDSHLLIELDRQRNAPWLDRLPNLRTRIAPEADGRVLLDVAATVDPALLAEVESQGGLVISSHPRFDALRVRLPLSAVEAIASKAAVRFVRPADRSMVQMVNTTEGDVAHGTDVARVDFGIDGSGVQVGAMSDSVDALAAVQATGDLPPTVTVLPGQDGIPGTSEGTALLEIIHDMAPGADLFFATGSGGQAQMAQNILDLAAAGCDVIVDDVLYFQEGVFQDGIIAQAVETVVSQGVLYFSSAGNSGNLNSGTAGVFEGDYVGTTLPPPLVGAAISAHDFGAGAEGSSNSNEVTLDSPFFFTLQWADPLAGATNDYDLFLLDSALTTVLAASTNTQNGSQDPFEFIDTIANDDTGNRLVVALFDGDPRFLHLNTHRGQLEFATEGQIFGHPAAEGAMAVAAVNVATAGGGQFTGGAANPVEVFSSDGPRRIFFNPDGSPVTFGEGPTSIVRQKPDVAAADGVSTATPGFDPFFGTSASAPHSAAIAALYIGLFPSVAIEAARNIFRSTALDIEDPGFDRDSGAGIMMAEPSLETTIFADGFESGDTSAWTK